MSDGSKTDYYNIPNEVNDLDDLSDYLDLTPAEFNCIKAIFGMAIERKTGDARHKGTNSKRDSNKLLHYAKRINKRLVDEKEIL